MAERIPPPLSPAARDLLRAFRDDESPTDARRRTGLVALESRLEPQAAAANGSFYAKVVAVTVGIAAAMLLAVKLVGVGVTALAADARQPAMEAPYQDEGKTASGHAVPRAPQAVSAERPQVAVVTEELAVTPEQVPASEAPVVPSAARSRPRPHAPQPSVQPVSAEDLVAELALIKQAQQAKQQGRHAEGLATLAEHARRFPRGTMVNERRVLQAELLCDSGQVEAARTKVRSFLAQRSGSALSGRMKAVCAENEE